LIKGVASMQKVNEVKRINTRIADGIILAPLIVFIFFSFVLYDIEYFLKIYEYNNLFK